jgi:hypothetical protein
MEKYIAFDSHKRYAWVDSRSERKKRPAIPVEMTGVGDRGAVR